MTEPEPTEPTITRDDIFKEMSRRVNHLEWQINVKDAALRDLMFSTYEERIDPLIWFPRVEAGKRALEIDLETEQYDPRSHD